MNKEELKKIKKECWKYKTAKDYQDYVRKENEAHDVVIVENILYTMDNYDMSGKEISYGNLKHKKMLTIITEDRYKKGFGDAIVEIDDLYSWRNDITYYE